MSRLMKGMTVLSLEQAIAGPYCTSKLSDQGARVIKIERPDGLGDFARGYDEFVKGASSYFTWLNRGKESLALDLKSTRCRDFVLEIVSASKIDVFVQNLAPGATERLGIGSALLRSLDHRLVTLDVSGYGDSGPLANYKAYDLLVAAESGICSVTGTLENPGRVGIPICDLICGQNGYSAVLQGLLQRELTGKGAGYSVSLFDSASEIMNAPFLQTKYHGKEPPRLGLSHPTIVPYGAFPCADDKKVLISVQNEREWTSLCKNVLCKPDLAKDSRFNSVVKRVENRDQVDRLIHECFRKYQANDLKKILLDSGIAFGQLSSVRDLKDHPQLAEICYENENNEKVSVIAPAIRPLMESYGRVPKLGEHTDAILKEFNHLLSKKTDQSQS